MPAEPTIIIPSAIASCISASIIEYLYGTLYKVVLYGQGTPFASNMTFLSGSVPLTAVVCPL